MSIIGSVDEVTQDGATGWIYNTLGQKPVVVQATLNGEVIGESTADGPREDLAEAGVGDGRCGFAMSFGFEVPRPLMSLINFRPFGGSVELPRTNLLGHIDAFRAIRAAYPGAGWSRSILGGLWTDKLDAPRRLQGRVATKMLAPELDAPLARFIEGGYLMMEAAIPEMPAAASRQVAQLPRGPFRRTGAELVASLLPDFVFAPAYLPLLEAIFEDLPMAAAVEVTKGNGTFQQAGAMAKLPNPAEALAFVLALDKSEAWLDIVSGSHALPEFLADGTSRFAAPAAASINRARALASSLDTFRLRPGMACVIAPGTLFRLRCREADAAFAVLLTPRRQTPLPMLEDDGPAPQMHVSGALVGF